MLAALLLCQAFADSVEVLKTDGTTEYMDTAITIEADFETYNDIQMIFGTLELTFKDQTFNEYSNLFSGLKRVDAIIMTGTTNQPLVFNDIFKNLLIIDLTLDIYTMNIGSMTGFSTLSYVQRIIIEAVDSLTNFQPTFTAYNMQSIFVHDNPKLSSLGNLLKNKEFQTNDGYFSLRIEENPELADLGTGLEHKELISSSNNRRIGIMDFHDNPKLKNIDGISNYNIIGPGFSLRTPREFKSSTTFVADSFLAYQIAEFCPTDMKEYQALEKVEPANQAERNRRSEEPFEASQLPCPIPTTSSSSSDLTNWAVVGIMLGIFTVVLLLLRLTGLLHFTCGASSSLQQNFL